MSAMPENVPTPDELPQEESPVESVRDLDLVPAAERQEKIDSFLQHISENMRLPGARNGNLNNAERIKHDLITGDFRTSANSDHLALRLRRELAAKRAVERIKALRLQAEKDKQSDMRDEQ